MSFFVEDLCVIRGGRTLVNAQDLSCPDGSVTVFMGANGSGKTSTISVLVGALPSPQSSIVLGSYDGRQPDRFALSLGPERLPDKMTALEAVQHLTGRIVRAEALTVLQEAALEQYANKKVGGFSTGMRQRLSIASALNSPGRNLVLDEPFNGLDPDWVAWLEQRLGEEAKKDRAILLSTHLLREAGAFADRAWRLRNGTITETDLSNRSAEPHFASIVIDADNAERAKNVLDHASIPVHALTMVKTDLHDLYQERGSSHE